MGSTFLGNICKELSKSTREQENSFDKAFGVLQVRFDMMSGLARFWNKDTLCYIMTYVVIIDNTIIEDERNENDPGAMITTKMVARCIGKRGTNGSTCCQSSSRYTRQASTR